MAHVLVYTSPGKGHLFPITPVIDELGGRGHWISIRTLGSQVEAMRKRGFDAGPIDPAIEAIAHDDYLARTPLGAQKRACRTFAQRAPLEAADLDRAIQAARPDAVLVDINTWGASAVAERWGGPWASWCPYPLPLPSRDAPPFGPGLRPATSPIGRLRDRLVGPFTLGVLERTLRPGVNSVRERLGLRPLSGAVDFFTAPPLLLAMTAEPFEYHRSDWPPNVLLVGPCDWDPPGDPPVWKADIKEDIVLVSTSSEFQDDGRLVQCALDALAGEDLHVVATLPAGDPSAFDLPPNAHVLAFVPHGPLLERAVCAVTHGGMGATQRALAHGVPVCAVPFGRDQLEVARRVEVAGAGTRLPAPRLRPARLRAKILDAIDHRDGAQRVADGFRSAGGAPAAADAFEALIAHQPVRHRL
jgi:MGT family glycosyltransferase